ncbi:MAG: (Fe-S)-binding protein [Acidobacteriota bacterium]
MVKSTNAWACYDCGKCTATCPLSRAGDSYSPRRHVLAANLGDEGAVSGDSSLYNCLTCALCDQRCPAQVDYIHLVQALRERSHGAGIEPQCPHGGALQSVMRMMARGGTQQDRLGWLADGLKTEAGKGEVYFWTGCATYYEAFFSDLPSGALDGIRAAVKVMNKAGTIPVVSPNERCCGHDLLWNGDRKNFEALARHNVKVVAESGAHTMVTSCAECYRTWKVDYGPFLQGRRLRILHFSEYLAENAAALKMNTKLQRRVTFQDPCRLGRHLGVYEPPRQVLAGIPGLELVEMGRTRKSAVCCAGGTWTNCDRYSKQIQVERLREAKASGADVLVTACPKCRIHFACAMKDPKLSEGIRIEMKDLAEIVADAVA